MTGRKLSPISDSRYSTRGGTSRIDLADHEPVLFQRAELLGQHALGDAGHPPPQLAEALGAILQMVEDDALPFAVDQIEGRLDRAARPARKISPFHRLFSQ